MPRVLIFIFLAVLVPANAGARMMAPSEEYGRVIINNYSEKAGVKPVVFDHWLHRAIYTCRLCHVDIGFAMESGGTNITQETNMQGYYCGACHNGKTRYSGKVVFAACSDRFKMEDAARCDRCHSEGMEVKKEYDFGEFTKSFPKKGLGDGVDWVQAEENGLIKLTDTVDGVSIKKPPLKPGEDFSIQAQGTWMRNVIFSHKKYATWNGCELCHPDIFPSVKKGEMKFTMFEIFDGQYCGVCHEKVAFSLYDCNRCHTTPVEQITP